MPINGELCGHIDIRIDPLGSMCRVDLLIGKYLKTNIQTNKYPTNQEKKNTFLWKEKQSLLI